MQSRLITDLHPLDQPDGTYRYALNAVSESSQGEQGRVSTEQGTKYCTDLPGKLVGQVYMSKGETCVFLDNNEIGIVKDCSYTSIIIDDSLNLSDANPVDGTYRLRLGCERTVYFTDGVNPPKVINLDQAELADLIREFDPGSISASTSQGGILDVGAYFVSVQYLDDNLNPTSFFDSLGPIVLVADPVNGQYQQIDGSFTDEVDPINGDSSSNKSLVINLTNPDLSYSSYRLAIGVATAATGSIQQVYLTPVIPIETLSYTISSLVGLTTTTVEDIAVDPVRISTAEHIEQLEGRLLLSNVGDAERDWSRLQTLASRITSKWYVQTLPPKTYEPSSAKYFDQRTKGYMAGDAYVFGIVYIFDDGSESPAFIIPPPPPTDFDLELLTVTGIPANDTEVSQEDVRHLGLTIGDQIERWKVFNTGGSNVSKFGYYEGETTYPETVDCDSGLAVWGDLAGEKVRYHVFPERNHVTNGGQTRNLGIEFNNVTRPQGVQGHFFVRAKKEVNLVSGTGYVYNVIEAPVGLIVQDGPSTFVNDPQFVNLINPEQYFDQNISYNYVRGVSETGGTNVFSIDEGPLVVGGRFDTRYDYTRLDGVHDDVRFNRLVDDTYVVPATLLNLNSGGYTVDGYNIEVEYNNHVSRVLNSEDLFPIEDEFTYVQLRNDVDPFPNYFTNSYVRISPNFNTSAGAYRCLGGDTFISEMNFHFTRGVEDEEAIGRLYGPVYFETRIDTSLRNDGDEKCFSKFDPSTGYLVSGNVDEGIQFVTDYYLETTSDEVLPIVNIDVCADNYVLNRDFYSQDQLRFYNSLPSNFDYCQGCRGLYKNRIVYSERGLQEETADSYRVFLANNYKDIEGSTGEITDLARYNDILYIFTDDAIWYQPASVQERVSSAGLVSYVGTGDFLSLPEKKITNYDRGGKFNKWSTNPTPYGIITVDTSNGKVFILNQSLEDLSDGVSSELRDKMGNSLEEYLAFKHTFDYGAVTAYDEDLDRVLITYKDYIPKNWGGVVASAPNIFDTLFYDGEFFVNLRGFGRINVTLGDRRYFENRSFTISRSFRDGWIGYHSYIPDFYIYGESKLFSGQFNKLWEHNSGNFLVYYGSRYSHIVEPVYKSSETIVWDGIDFITFATRDRADIRWETFNKLIAYNSYQSTNIQALITKNTLEGEDYLIDVLDEGYLLDEYNERWHVNGLRDEVGVYEIPLFLPSPDQRNTDKEPNILAFTGKEWFETEPLRDQYLIVRFIYEGSAKLTTLIAQAHGRNRR